MAKVNGVDLDDLSYFRSEIEANFGSIKVFALETNLSYRKTLSLFNDLEFSSEDYERVSEAYKKHMKSRDFKDDIPYRITDKEREKIRICILSNFKSYTKFCLKHKEFNAVYVTNVVKGNLKLRSGKYFRFVKLLTKKYKLKVEFN